MKQAKKSWCRKREGKGFYEKIRNCCKASTQIHCLEGMFEIRKIDKYALYYNVINNVTIRDKIK